VRSRELTNPVDGVVVVGGEDEPAPLGERKGLADELQRTAGVRREDDRVLVPRSVDECQDRRAGAVGQLRRRRRRRVLRVGIAQDAVAQQRQVLPDLRIGVEAAPV
jgi:hypothetical protein